MAQLKAGLITIAALLVLWAGAWVVLSQKSEVVPPPAAATSSSTPSTATSSSAVPAPEPTILVKTVTAPSANVRAETAATVASPATATLVVNGSRFALHAPAGSTLEQAMSQMRTEGGFSYASKTYPGLGAFVTEIQGSASGSGHYWILYVNGEKSSTGISSTRIRSGDLIEWKLEKSY